MAQERLLFIFLAFYISSLLLHAACGRCTHPPH
jgi:hypothetical protein